mmetsp:Transcript_64414/g.197027  ORF Transcript_64414/g.197027 Transcript_64414/m.197027 type:complete len:221 (-) Transcript_64414:304-966(-)
MALQSQAPHDDGAELHRCANRKWARTLRARRAGSRLLLERGLPHEPGHAQVRAAPGQQLETHRDAHDRRRPLQSRAAGPASGIAAGSDGLQPLVLPTQLLVLLLQLIDLGRVGDVEALLRADPCQNRGQPILGQEPVLEPQLPLESMLPLQFHEVECPRPVLNAGLVDPRLPRVALDRGTGDAHLGDGHVLALHGPGICDGVQNDLFLVAEPIYLQLLAP